MIAYFKDKADDGKIYATSVDWWLMRNVFLFDVQYPGRPLLLVRPIDLDLEDRFARLHQPQNCVTIPPPEWNSLVVRQAHTLKAVGSNPTSGTI